MPPLRLQASDLGESPETRSVHAPIHVLRVCDKNTGRPLTDTIKGNTCWIGNQADDLVIPMRPTFPCRNRRKMNIRRLSHGSLALVRVF